MTHEILADNSIKLQILYNDLAYVEMVEEPKMSSKDLLAAIGGHLHLFLGMSFLSFIELLEIVCSIGFTTTKKDTKSEKLINFQDAEKLKMDAIPNAIRSPHICLSIVWFVLFICASGACVYLIFDTIQEYNKHDVVTSLEHVNDQSIAFRFCNCFPLTSDYAIELMRNLSLLNIGDSTKIFLKIQEYVNKTRGYYLTYEELSSLSDPSRMVVYCSINGLSCEFEFYYDVFNIGCYRVIPKYELGNNYAIIFNPN